MYYEINTCRMKNLVKVTPKKNKPQLLHVLTDV